jgi:hypothetical protein
MLEAGDVPIDPALIVVKMASKDIVTPARATILAHDPIFKYPLTKLYLVSNQEPLFTVTEDVAKA